MDTLHIPTCKNKKVIAYMLLVVFWLFPITTLATVEILLGEETVSFWDWAFIIGVLLSCFILFFYAIHTLFFLPRKDLVFTIDKTRLTMEDFPKTDDGDYNKSIDLVSVKKAFHHKGWVHVPRPFFERLNGIYLEDVKGKKKVFLDLSMPEVMLSSPHISETISFIEKHLSH